MNECRQSAARRVIQVVVQQSQKTLQKAWLVREHMLGEGIRKPAGVGLLNGIQRCRRLGRQGRWRRDNFHPIVHAVGKQLPAQHLGRPHEHARWRHLAGQHLGRGVEEIEIVRAGTISQGGRHRIAVTAAGTAHTLQEAGLVGRHRAQQDLRQIANVHAHLQRWCGRQQVLKPWLRRLALESKLQRLAFLAFKQAGVFSGHHAPQVGAFKPVSQPTARRDLFGVVLMRGVQAGHAQQRRYCLDRHGQPPLAAAGGQHGHIGVQLQRLGRQG